MPGIVTGISYNPLPGISSVLLQTSSAFCHINLEKAAPGPGGGGGGGANGKGGDSARKRKRPTEEDKERENNRRGDNFRVFLLDNPCLFLGFTGANSAIMLEKVWADVLSSLPPPLFRNVFGH
jgi:hypothetical protein